MTRLYLLLSLLVVAILAIFLFQTYSSKIPGPASQEPQRPEKRELERGPKEAISVVGEASEAENEASSALKTPEVIIPSATAPLASRIGGMMLTLEFEDPYLSAIQTGPIARDLAHAFSHLTARITGDEDERRLTFEGKGRMWPDVLNAHWKITGHGGSQLLQVPKSVTEAYKEAFMFIEENDVEELQIASLLRNVEQGLADPDSFVPLSAPGMPAEYVKKALQKLKQGQIKMPSVLAYELKNVNGVPTLIAETLYVQLEEDVVTYSQEVWVIKVGEQWKIAL